MLWFAVRRKENVPTDAFLTLSEDVTLRLTLCMKYRFGNPNQNAVWLHCNSLIKKSYCKVGWDPVLCSLDLFLMFLTQELTPLNYFCKADGRLCYIYIYIYIHTHTHTHTHTFKK